MAHSATQATGSILDHYADVIEGGNAHNGGTVYYGIPGRYSNDARLRSGADTPLAADAAGDESTIQVASTYAWANNRWIRPMQPSYFLLCTAGADAAVQKARRITAWDPSFSQLTTDAFPVAPGATAEFIALEGFRRAPNTVDINDPDEGTPGGYDRFFDLELEPGVVLDWGGDGTQTWEGTLTVVLRLLKHSRIRDWRASYAENLIIIGNVMSSNTSGQDHRDGAYVRFLAPPSEAPSVRSEDRAKVVAAMPMRIRYRVERGL